MLAPISFQSLYSPPKLRMHQQPREITFAGSSEQVLTAPPRRTAKQKLAHVIGDLLGRRPVVRRFDIPITHLPKSWVGTKLIHITDLHADAFTSDAYLQKLKEMINAEKPDIIAFTGDVIHRGTDHLQTGADFLSQLNAKIKIAVLGNHDMMGNPQGKAVQKALEKAGFDVLHNMAKAYFQNGESIYISGLEDIYTLYPDVEQLKTKLPNEQVAHINLWHYPNSVELEKLLALNNKPSLILSGHTHHGHHDLNSAFLTQQAQRFIKADPKLWKGLIKPDNQTTVHIGAGLGQSFCIPRRFTKNDQGKITDESYHAVLPFRFGTRPEVAIITLQSA